LNSQRQPTRGGPPACGLGVGLTTPHRKKSNALRNVSKGLGPVLILWNDLSNIRRLNGLSLSFLRFILSRNQSHHNEFKKYAK